MSKQQKMVKTYLIEHHTPSEFHFNLLDGRRRNTVGGDFSDGND